MKAAGEFKTRALSTVKEAKSHLQNGFLESAVSTAYYACFYAVSSRFSEMGVAVSSHKQAGIQFRRHFIMNKKMEVRFSETWQKLSDWRMEVDYSPTPDIDKAKAAELVLSAEKFVETVFKTE